MHTMDTSPYSGHLSIMNAICILQTPLHTADTSPCILWTPLHYECNMHTMDTSSYCGHLSIMNTICILQTPLHSSFHKLWTPLHTKETYAQCEPLRILQTPLHTAVYTYAYMYHRHLCIIQTPLHTQDSYYRQFSWSILRTPGSFWCLYIKKRFDSTILYFLKTFMVIICKNMNVKDFLTATKQPFFSLRFVDLVVPVEKINMVIIVESALSLSSWFTGTPLKYLETNNNSNTA